MKKNNIFIDSMDVAFRKRVKNSKILCRSMWAMNRDLEMHENFYSLDVRIHHRIWDV